MNEISIEVGEGNIEYLGEVRKGPDLVLKVSVGDFHERTYIYVQTWRKDESDQGEGTVTHLGLTLRPRTLRDLLPLCQAALEKATAREREQRIGGRP
jgi:hypothetical protein